MISSAVKMLQAAPVLLFLLKSRTSSLSLFCCFKETEIKEWQFIVQFLVRLLPVSLLFTEDIFRRNSPFCDFCDQNVLFVFYSSLFHFEKCQKLRSFLSSS